MGELLVPLTAATEAEIADACGGDPRWSCREVYELTGSQTLADAADWLIGRPLKIIAILLVAALAIRLIRRALDHTMHELAEGRVKQRLAAARELGGDSLRETELGENARAEQRAAAISSVLHNAVAFVVWPIAALLVLGELEVDLAPLLAGAGVVGLAVGFGAQSLVKDFFSGVFILIEDQFAVGDVIDLGEAVGEVEELTLRTTRLRALDGVVWHVPNGEILRVANMSQHWSRSLLDIEVGYESDLAEAKAVIQSAADEVAAGDDDILEAPEVWGVEELGANGVMIRLVVKTRPAAQWRVARELRERIKVALDRAQIEIPFPQQTVWHRGEEGQPAS